MKLHLSLIFWHHFFISVGTVGFLGGSIIATAVYIVASNEGDASEPNSLSE